MLKKIKIAYIYLNYINSIAYKFQKLRLTFFLFNIYQKINYLRNSEWLSIK